MEFRDAVAARRSAYSLDDGIGAIGASEGSVIDALRRVIPLVPGYGLYRTMEYMVQTDYMQALAAGMETALVAGAIALSLGFSTVVARNAFRLLGLRHHRG